MNGFDPFNLLKDTGLFEALHSLEKIQQTPWLAQYINNLLGPNFWSQIMRNQQYDFYKTEVFQTTDEVIVMADMPGLEKESDVRISLKGLTLFLEAIIPVGNTKNQPDRVILHTETNNRSGRKITRSINLPSPVKSFGAKAIYKNGVFEIRLPKEPLPDESHIEVQFL